MSSYSIWITTGDEALGGTDSNVFIQLFGSNARTEAIYLPPEDIFAFEQGNTDKFVLEAPDLGNITRCCIGQDGSVDSGWYVKTVRIRYDATNQEWVFPFDRWLGTEEAGTLSACLDL
jgi:hypothetical protein